MLKCDIDQSCTNDGEDSDPLLGSVNGIPNAPPPYEEDEKKRPFDSTPFQSSDDERKIN